MAGADLAHNFAAGTQSPGSDSEAAHRAQ